MITITIRQFGDTDYYEDSNKSELNSSVQVQLSSSSAEF